MGARADPRRVIAARDKLLRLRRALLEVGESAVVDVVGALGDVRRGVAPRHPAERLQRDVRHLLEPRRRLQVRVRVQVVAVRRRRVQAEVQDRRRRRVVVRGGGPVVAAQAARQEEALEARVLPLRALAHLAQRKAALGQPAERGHVGDGGQALQRHRVERGIKRVRPRRLGGRGRAEEGRQHERAPLVARAQQRRAELHELGRRAAAQQRQQVPRAPVGVFALQRRPVRRRVCVCVCVCACARPRAAAAARRRRRACSTAAATLSTTSSATAKRSSLRAVPQPADAGLQRYSR